MRQGYLIPGQNSDLPRELSKGVKRSVLLAGETDFNVTTGKGDKRLLN